MIICTHETCNGICSGEDTMGKRDTDEKVKEISEEEIGEQKAIIESVVGDYIYKSEAAWALGFAEERLREIGISLAEAKGRKVVNQITSRTKSAESIYKKIKRKKYSIDRDGVFRCNDLLGVRMVCLFMDDVYEVAERLRHQEDIRIIKEKDYIRKPKSNGYMSLHLIIEVPVKKETDKSDRGSVPFENKNGNWKKIEVQLRTVAMDFWSVLDHQLVYKKEFPGADSVGKELKAYAATIAELDKNMLQLRQKIEHLNI